MVAPDIFGEYAVVIGQLLSIFAIAGILISFARWLVHKRQKNDREIYFMVLIAVIISTTVLATLRYLNELDKLGAIEGQNLKLNIQQVKNQNLTLENQQLLRQILTHQEKFAATLAQRPVIANEGVPIIELPSTQPDPR